MDIEEFREWVREIDPDLSEAVRKLVDEVLTPLEKFVKTLDEILAEEVETGAELENRVERLEKKVEDMTTDVDEVLTPRLQALEDRLSPPERAVMAAPIPPGDLAGTSVRAAQPENPAKTSEPERPFDSVVLGLTVRVKRHQADRIMDLFEKTGGKTSSSTFLELKYEAPYGNSCTYPIDALEDVER